MSRPPALDPGTSLADYAASTRGSPEPVERTLSVVAERSFTGEVTFEVGEGSVVYTDAGLPYYAEHLDDPPLGARLVAEGVVTDEQLHRGTVGVGDVEHLGRLFERDATIDRDAVMEATERLTDAVINELLPDDATVRFTAYRHHRSGIHRWFVGPRNEVTTGDVASLGAFDTTPFDVAAFAAPAPTEPEPELERAPTPLPAFDPLDDAEIRIEWREPGPLALVPHASEPSSARPSVTLEPPPPSGLPVATLPPPTAVTAPVEDVLLPPPPLPVEPPPIEPAIELAEPVSIELGTVEPVSVEPAIEVGTVEFAEPLNVDPEIAEEPAEEPAGSPVGESEEVDDAVRRALAAIERAALEPKADARLRVREVEVAEFSVPKLLDPSVLPDQEPASDDLGNPASTTRPAGAWPAPSLPVPVSGAAGVAVLEAPVEVQPIVAEDASADRLPEPGQASVVFLDHDDEANERRGALRRLIDSFRRK